MNDLDWIKKWANYLPEKTAILDLDTNESFSYLDLHLYAMSITYFLSKNYKEGDRIVILGDQSAFMVALFSACQRLGLILVPINFRLSEIEIKSLLEDCQPSLVIYSEHYEGRITLVKDFYPITSQINFIDDVKINDTKDTKHDKEFEIKEDLPVFLFYTSGTTSAPKGVLYTNKMMFWNSLNTTMQLELTSRDRTVNVLPPYHTSGWNIFVLPLLHNGGFIAMLKKFDSKEILKQLDTQNATVFIGLPTILQIISKDEEFKNSDLKSLRYIITGGEYINKQLIKQWKDQKGVFIRPGYGLTEAGPSITSLHQDVLFDKINSIGKANFYVELDIKDSKGKSLKENEVGELCIKGFIVTPGYWNNSVATKDRLKEDWFYTGDLAYKDSDGYYYLKGRVDDMYISGGENIFPQEIEQVLNQYDGIEKSVVLSTKDDIWGNAGIAFIKTSKKRMHPEEIQDFLKDKLAKYKYPKYYVFLEEFPATSVGKISRKKLYQLFNETKRQAN